MADKKPKFDVETLNPSFVKILISFVFGGIVWGLSELFQNGDMNTGQMWSILISLFAASVAFVVQHLITVEKQNDATRHELREGLSRIDEATELFGLVEQSAVQIDLVTQLVRNATGVDKEMPTLVQRFAQTEIERISTLLRELGEGDVTYEGEDRDWLLGLARNVERSIDALSLAVVDQGPGEFDGGFWITDAGQRYLEIQRERAKAGVRIRRIFYVDTQERLKSETFQQISRMHVTAGVDVRVLTAGQLTSALGVDDFIVFDGVVSYEIMASNTLSVGELVTHTFVRTLLILERPRVRQRIERFRELWELATELPP
ncbi:hypothetical protein Acor_05700 [Acrocarpospora corrugata]|uniref:Phosphatidylserine/phosphatidylglycerophosphate/ cardiolipin synthase family protein n=1 Tax=Acrocarpospora corrugata TaxID=35763 RepID=A0A5M3VQN1_9ACTN|nr:phosphatidylserine/phosphatidylglycerophosphate/cardiolipin synthase family protein [Acrocarpospora corrugata]GER98508.1 hypothetical protein Acor_05700 [Acrocarpospora corrugata]